MVIWNRMETFFVSAVETWCVNVIYWIREVDFKIHTSVAKRTTSKWIWWVCSWVIRLQFLRPSVPPHGSAEQSTNTLLVAWPVHYLLSTWPASPQRRFFLFFHTLLHFRQFFCVLVCTCLSLYLPSHAYFDVFINLQSFHHNVPPHGSAEQSTKHSFSRLAGAQFTNYMTCLTSQSSAELSTSLSSWSHFAQHPISI